MTSEITDRLYLSMPQITPILKVAVPTPLRRLFDYLPPECADSDSYQPGVRVRVPFGRRQLVGILITKTYKSELPKDKLKRALAIIDESPIISSHLLTLCLWSADYYQHPVGEVLASVLPATLRQGDDLSIKQQSLWRLTEAGKTVDLSSLSRAPKQQTIVVTMRCENSDMDAAQLQENNLSTSALKALRQKGFVDLVEAEFTHDIQHLLAESTITLNDEQQKAYDAVINAGQAFNSFLLQGVTGSGKTEVYLQLIETTLRQGKQALVLIPEIGLTPQTVARFNQRFKTPIVVLNSRVSHRERHNAWIMASKGQACIVIGTRLAVFTPMQDLGIIIIDEEQDLSFKQQEGFRYSARDIAVKRARMDGVPIVLGSATPSLESLLNVKRERYQLLVLKQRAGNALMPTIKLLDLRNKYLQDGFSPQALSEIKQHLEQKNQVLIFLNRRGFAPTILCHACGWVANCKQCDMRMTWHKSTQRLCCHHCGNQTIMASQCPSCQSPELKALGVGTERTEEALQSLFPFTSIIRVDRDSTRKKQAMMDIIDEVHKGEPCILVGTQMLAKGHHFPHITLVIILDADNGLFSADFRGQERLGQLITQVAGRAGRETKQGNVIIQTHQPHHPLLNCLISEGHKVFADKILAEREQACLPPYSYFALVSAEAKNMEAADVFLRSCKQTVNSSVSEHGDQIMLLGPVPAPMQKRAGYYRAQLLIQATSRSMLQSLLNRLISNIELNKTPTNLRWSVDVDPQDMF